MIVENVTEIAVPPARVWAALCDFASYRKWNPYREVLGAAGLGERVVIRIGPDPDHRRKLPCKISVFEPGRMLTFLSGRPLISSARESFHLEAKGANTVLRHRAEMSGLAPLLVGPKFEARLLKVYKKLDGALANYLASGIPQGNSARNTRRLARRTR